MSTILHFVNLQRFLVLLNSALSYVCLYLSIWGKTKMPPFEFVYLILEYEYKNDLEDPQYGRICLMELFLLLFEKKQYEIEQKCVNFNIMNFLIFAYLNYPSYHHQSSFFIRNMIDSVIDSGLQHFTYSLVLFLIFSGFTLKEIASFN